MGHCEEKVRHNQCNEGKFPPADPYKEFLVVNAEGSAKSLHAHCTLRRADGSPKWTVLVLCGGWF